MDEFLLSLLFPARHFAFHPVACAVVAALFSLCAALPDSSWRMRGSFVCCALCWWGFAYLEYGTSVQNNIRVDLVFLLPIFQITAYAGIWMFFRWINKNW